jgi:aspartate aminotransferase
VRSLPPALATSVPRLGTETAFSVLARARALEHIGRDIVHLEIGEPDFATPPHVVEAAFAALRAGETHYCPSAGIPELREAVAAELSSSRGVDVDAARVLVGNGAKPFLFFTILAVCDPGDEIVYPDPGFPIYESAIRWSGGTPVPLPLREENDFAIALEDLEACLSDRTKLVILNSPHNPTGGVTPETDLAAAAELIMRTSTWVLSDEVYARITYGERCSSISSVPGMLERTVLLDSFSKTYAMTGWRCGYAALPSPLIEPLTRFFVNSTSCVPPFVQCAGVAALTGPQDIVTTMLEELRKRRDFVVGGLNALPGVSCRLPPGAFYAFPNVTGVPVPAEQLAARLLEEAGVALLPGSAFGEVGRQHLRVSYATSRQNIAQGLERMADFLSTLR